MALHIPQHSIMTAIVSVALLKAAPGRRIEVTREELEDNLQRLVHVDANFETDNYRVTVQRDSLYRDAERPRIGTDISAATNIAHETDVHEYTYVAGPGACRG